MVNRIHASKRIVALGAVLFLFSLCTLSGVLGVARAFASESPNVTTHTKSEIVDYLAKSGASVGDKVTYAVDPVPNTEMGELSEEAKSSAVKMLNNVRYIAGLNEVGLGDEYGRLAQAAAFADNAIGMLTHYPAKDGTQPEDMPDDLWQLGILGASKANIASGYGTLTSAIRDGWMDDGDMRNIARVGHRRWCLNPKMLNTGFGIVNRYSAMYSLDSKGSGTQTNVVWPAQLTPVEYFDAGHPWTISVGKAISDPSSVKVAITKKGDSSTQWAFDTLSTSASSDVKSSYFNVNNDSYGQAGCIIFRPENFEFKAGDVFHVVASNVNGSTIEYDVEFFSGYPLDSFSFSDEVAYLSYSGMPLKPTVVPADASGYAITWTSSDETVATVDATGRVTEVAPGETTITATVDGAYTKAGRSLSASVKLVVPKSIFTDTDVTVDYASCQYTGSAIAPTVTVVDRYTKETLVEGRDYRVSISGDAVEPGESTTVWVRGMNRYSSNKGVYAYVSKRTVTEDMVALDPGSFVYSGQLQQPRVSVGIGELTLEKDTDYTVSYSGGTNAGEYKVTVTGAGSHFQGRCQKAFSIQPKELEESMLAVELLSLPYNEAEQTPNITLAFGEVGLFAGKDYVVSADRSSVDVGTYELTVQGKGNFGGVLSKTFAISAADVKVKGGNKVEAAAGLTYGQKLSELDVVNAEFVSAVTGKAVEGAFAFDEPDAVLETGEHEVAWTFVPESPNYNPLSGKLGVAVGKATPTVIVAPSAASVAYHPTKTLADCPIEVGEVSVEGTWAWDAPDTALVAPGGAYGCTFTPADTTNYEPVSASVEVEVAKAVPSITDLAASGITYGESLADSELSGVAHYSDSDTTVVDGAFSWADASVKPWVADGGKTTYKVLFTPADAQNYETVEADIALEVAKADKPASWPSAAYNVSYNMEQLEASLLPEGWVFGDADLGTPLAIGETSTFTVRYAGEDAGNYENESVQVSVTRSTCAHERTELRDAKDATCTEAGYSGDAYCTVCDEKLADGYVIAAYNHDWDEGAVTLGPTCISEGVRTYTCRRCKDIRTEPVAKVAHTWEWATVDAATCVQIGTEQQVCTVCGEKGETRNVPVNENHRYGAWRMELSPSCTDPGTERRICGDCGAVEDREVSALGHAWGKWAVVQEPTEQEAGLKRRVCDRCSEVEEEAVSALGSQNSGGRDLPDEISGEVSPANPVSAEAVERQIAELKSEGDLAGSTFELLQAKGAAKSATAVKLSWKHVEGATGYVVYGNKAGKANGYQKIATVTGTSFTQKKLKKGAYYKYLVVAVDGQAALAIGKTVHVATKGGKAGNVKSIKTKAKAKTTLKPGKKLKLGAKAVPQSKKLKVKKFRALSYATSDPSVAIVDKKGTVTAKKPGTCTVYAYAQNGMSKAVKVQVKG